MLLYYLRHADPIYNPDSLTPLGKRQAEALARRLASHGIDKIFASSSQRAQDTARPTAEITKKPVTVLDWAHESTLYAEMACRVEEAGRNYWYYHQQKYREAFLRNDVRALGREWYTHELFRDTTMGEGITRIQREADNFLRELGYEHDLENNCFRAVKPNHARVALFAHQGVGEAFLSCILDIPYPMFATHHDMSHSTMTVIDFGECVNGVYEVSHEEGSVVIPQLITYANDSHIWREGLPTRYENGIYF